MTNKQSDRFARRIRKGEKGQARSTGDDDDDDVGGRSIKLSRRAVKRKAFEKTTFYAHFKHPRPFEYFLNESPDKNESEAVRSTTSLLRYNCQVHKSGAR